MERNAEYNSVNPNMTASNNAPMGDILSHYTGYWGTPANTASRAIGDVIINVYDFYGTDGGYVRRIATTGVSALADLPYRRSRYELYMALPPNYAGATFEVIVDLIASVAVYSCQPDVRFEVGRTIPETPLMPKEWKPCALLLDEARGEPELLSTFSLGGQDIELIWLIPIYKSEYDLSHSRGLGEFDRLEQEAEWSLADPRRSPFCE